MVLKAYPGCYVQYIKWAGIPASREDTFWTNPTVRNLIKNDYKVLVTRKNTFNGKLYGEDNTIFAWDIYNVCTPYACLLLPHSRVHGAMQNSTRCALGTACFCMAHILCDHQCRRFLPSQEGVQREHAC